MGEVADAEAVIDGRNRLDRPEMSEKEKKLEVIKESLASQNKERIQTIQWTPDILNEAKTIGEGPLYCCLCGKTIVSRNFSDHIYRNHGLQGKGKAVDREAVRAIADAIVDRQRSFELDCTKIPQELIQTEGQQLLMMFFIQMLKESHFPIINQEATFSEELRIVKSALDKIMRKQDEAAAAHLVLRGEFRNRQPIDDDHDLGAPDAAPAACPVDEAYQPDDFYDIRKDPIHSLHMEMKYRPKAGFQRDISRRSHFYHRLIIKDQPLLAEYEVFIQSEVRLRHGPVKVTGGIGQYPSRVAMFFLCVKRKSKRLGTELTPTNVANAYCHVSPWFTAIQNMGISDSVMEAFANALIHFFEWVRPRVNNAKFAEHQLQLDLAIREISGQRERANRRAANQTALEGCLSNENQPQYPYGLLCSVFRHAETQNKFARVKNRVENGLIEKDDVLFVLRGLIYGIVTLNSSRLDAIYKIRAKSIIGKLLDDGTMDPSTGLQEISIEGGEKLWAAPFLIPKNYVSRSDLHKEIRGVIVLEELTKEWLEVYTVMRNSILEPKGIAGDPEALFFVNFEGDVMDSPSVHHSMKNFLASTEYGHLPAGCNTVRHTVAQEELSSVISAMYRMMQENHVHTLQGHQLSTLITDYTDQIYKLMATGYLRLRQLENTEAAPTNEEPLHQGEGHDRVLEIRDPSDNRLHDEQLDYEDEMDTMSDYAPAAMADFEFFDRNQMERDGSYVSTGSLDLSYMDVTGDEDVEDNGMEQEEEDELVEGNEDDDDDDEEEEVSRFVSSDEFLRKIAKHNRLAAEVPLRSVKDQYFEFIRRSNRKSVQGWSWLAVRGSDEAGLGVYAKADLKKHSVICDYKGVVMSKQVHAQRLLQALDEENQELYNARDTYWVDAEVQKGFKTISFGVEAHEPVQDGRIVLGRLINHSSEHPNLRICGIAMERGKETHLVVYFEAMRKIFKNEQLFFDYGPSYSHLNRCFCHLCPPKRGLDQLPKLPSSVTLPPHEDEQIVSMSQTCSDQPMHKRARGYEVRRLLADFEMEVKSQLCWSRKTFSKWCDAVNEARGVFSKYNKMNLVAEDSLMEALKKTHEKAKENKEKMVVILSTKNIAAMLLGDLRGAPTAVLHIVPHGFQHAEVPSARHPILLKSQLTDMRIFVLDELDSEAFKSLTNLVNSE